MKIRIIAVLFTLVMLAAYGLFADGCASKPVSATDLKSARLRTEKFENDFCALRAKVRAAEIDAGIEVP